MICTFRCRANSMWSQPKVRTISFILFPTHKMVLCLWYANERDTLKGKYFEIGLWWMLVRVKQVSWTVALLGQLNIHLMPNWAWYNAEVNDPLLNFLHCFSLYKFGLDSMPHSNAIINNNNSLSGLGKGFGLYCCNVSVTASDLYQA